LQLTIKRLLHQLYGRRSERLVVAPGQLSLNFDDGQPLESDPSIVSALQEPEVVEGYLVHRRRHRERRSEQLPEHLERRSERIEPRLPAGVTLADCQPIGVDVVELLEFERGKLWVRRLEYPKYKLPESVGLPSLEAAASVEVALLRSAELVVEADIVVAAELVVDAEPTLDTKPNIGVVADVSADQALPAVETRSLAATESGMETEQDLPSEPAIPAEHVASECPSTVPVVVESHRILQAPRVVTLTEGGRFGFGLAAEVLFSKYGLHVPLYREQDNLAQLGWSPSRSTLCQIVASSAELLAPLAELLKAHVLAGEVLGTDDTPVTLLTPGEGDGSREARFWMYRGPAAAPFNAFAFTDSRARAGPDQFLAHFRGILSADCYSGYVNIEQVTLGRIRFSACLAHARRKVFDAREQQPLLASQMLAVIGELYDIEDRGRLFTDADRLALRQRESVPVMARLRALLDSDAARCVLPRSSLGEALGYLRNHWPAFQVYLHDGRVPIDNTDVERDLRRVAIGRKNWLFIGSVEAGERTANILSVVASAHRHDLDVWAYLRDVLEQLAQGRAAAGGNPDGLDPALLASLLPDTWAHSHPGAIRTFRAQEKQTRATVRRFKRARRRLPRPSN
jgi:transposase